MGNCCVTAQSADDGLAPDEGDHYDAQPNACSRSKAREVVPMDGNELSRTHSTVPAESSGDSVMGEHNSSSAPGSLSRLGSFMEHVESDEERQGTPRTQPHTTDGGGGSAPLHISPNSASELLPMSHHSRKTVAATIAASNPLSRVPARKPTVTTQSQSFPPTFPMPQFDDLSDLDSIDPAYAEKLTERVRKIPALSSSERQTVIEAWLQNCSNIVPDGDDPSPIVLW